MKTEIIQPRAKHWTAEKPNLYTLEIYANGEKIEESIGFREVTIDGKVFKINGNPVKLMDSMPKLRNPAPTLGQDNDSVYQDIFGYTPEKIAKMRADGVI